MDLDRAVRTIDALLPRLDVPVDYLPRHSALILALGMRALNLHRIALRLAAESTDASLILIRSLADIAITVRWLEECPKLHVALWQAEDDRLRLRTDERRMEFARRNATPTDPAFSQADRGRMERRIARCRRIARRANVRIGPSRRHSLLPTLADRSQAGDMWAAYYILLDYASNWTHSGGRAMVNDRFERTDGGTYLQMASLQDPELVKAFSLPLLCLALESVSRQCETGTEAEIREIRESVVIGTSGTPTGSTPGIAPA